MTLPPFHHEVTSDVFRRAAGCVATLAIADVALPNPLRASHRQHSILQNCTAVELRLV